MEDLNDKIARLLSSPNSLEQIQAALSAITAEQPAATEPPAAVPPPPPASPGMGFPDLSLIAKMAPLLSGLKQDDNDTRLLAALRPYLHGRREQRLDDAVQLLKLSKLLPLLQGGLGGDSHGG